MILLTTELDKMVQSEKCPIQINYNLSGTPSLNMRMITEENTPHFSILNYNKELLSSQQPTIHLYRSVVFSYPETNLLSFSPPKMMSPGIFFTETAPYYANEYIDGLLIHLFYDERNQGWKLATHNKLIYPYDGTKEHSLSNILCNILKYDSSRDISKLPFWDNLSKEYCYNFTLANKYSHVHTKRTLYLTSVYKINKNNVFPISPDVYEKWQMFDTLRGLINFPTDFTRTFQQTSCLQDEINSLNISGIVIMNKDNGNRCKYVCDRYKIYKLHRHIEPYYLYTYICYVKMNQHEKMLPFIYKSQYNMKKIHSIWKAFVRYIHQTYVDNYVLKKELYINDQLSSYLRDIHQTYYIRRKLQVAQPKVSKDDVTIFLSKKHPQEVFDLLKNI